VSSPFGRAIWLGSRVRRGLRSAGLRHGFWPIFARYQETRAAADGGEDDAVAAVAGVAQVQRAPGRAAGGGAAAAAGAGGGGREGRGGGALEGAQGFGARLAAARWRGQAQLHAGGGGGVVGRRVRERRHARGRVAAGGGPVPAVGARLLRVQGEHRILSSPT
jgi:hypothetical protein